MQGGPRSAQVRQEDARPLHEVRRDGVAGLVVDRRPVPGDVLDRRFRIRVDIALGRGDEDAREAELTGKIDNLREWIEKAVKVSLNLK
jgi:hypothetical protein